MASARRLLSSAIPLAILMAALVQFYDVKSGDASIYFTYFKNFFPLPFSYQTGVVSFGATSPLHVILHAPIFYLGGGHWLLMSKCLNFGLLYLAVRCMNRTLHGDTQSLLLLSLLTLINVPLIRGTASITETPLAYLAVAGLHLLLSEKRFNAALVTAGSLPLVRPELGVLSLVVFAYVLTITTNRRRTFLVCIAAGTPALTYHAYMWAMTGAYLPTSMQGRLIYSLESSQGWLFPFFESFGPLLSPLAHRSNLIYFLGTFAVIWLLVTGRFRSLRIELMLLAAVLFPFALFPPRDLTSRYLVPATPILAVLIVRCGRQFRSKYALPAATAGLGFIAAVLLLHANTLVRYDYDRLLLRDLSERLNVVTGPEDRVLIYEIQAQYYLAAGCVSMDGIVGGEILTVLAGKEPLERFVARTGITHIVTMNALNYRRIFRHTFLPDLYEHDLHNPVGATFRTGGLVLEKMLTNPYFADASLYQEVPWSGLGRGGTLRVYGSADQRWAGSHIMWNSVYRVRADRRN